MELISCLMGKLRNVFPMDFELATGQRRKAKVLVDILNPGFV